MSIANESIVFTGKLVSMNRRQAQALVFALGGCYQEAITQKTTLLVAGLSKIDLFVTDSCSKKRQEAEKWIKRGVPLRIITEKEFLVLVSQALTAKIDMIL